MSKIFEDIFSELQADMVSICLEYVHNRVEKLYIYCSFEEKVISSDFFCYINGKLLKKHKLNDALKNNDLFQYDISVERQKFALTIINDDIEKIFKLCSQQNREMPTEIKLVYDVNKNSVQAEYKYDLIYSNDPVKTADDIAREWFEELQSKLMLNNQP